MKLDCKENRDTNFCKKKRGKNQIKMSAMRQIIIMIFSAQIMLIKTISLFSKINLFKKQEKQ